MKKQKIFFTTALLFLFMFLACDEETRGPLVVDNTIPSSISSVEIENLPGGAKLIFKAPTDEDALYIEASYERNGKQVATRSSIYKNEIIVEGLNNTNAQDVSLVVVDRSENKSAPVIATINPLKSPLKSIFESFEMVADFGGPRVKYKNPFDIRFELLLYTIENGNKVYQASDFISEGEGTENTFTIFRGFDPVNTTFGVEAVDRWDNTTPLFQTDNILPFKEVLLDRLLMEGIELTNDEPTAFQWVLNNLFDGNRDTGFHTDTANPGALFTPQYTEPHYAFTMDMGQLAKLSRLKLWLRRNCCNTPFGHGDPRLYEIWGIDEIPADNGETLNGWTKLVENGEIIKPSGAPLGEHSAEDIAVADSGIEILIPLEAPAVRYIRFVNIENWSGTKFVHVMEFEFYGQL